jgi:hypothetical protein
MNSASFRWRRSHALAFGGLALPQAEHGGLTRIGPPIFSLALNLVHVPRQPANIGHIDFNGFVLAAEVFNCVALHRQPDAMKHEPCALLSDSKRTVNLIGRNAVLAVGRHPDRHEPLIKSNGRILHDRASLNRKLALLVNALALPFTLVRKKPHIVASASRTHTNVVWPSLRRHIGDAVIRIREELDDRFQSLRFVAHVSNMGRGI